MGNGIERPSKGLLVGRKKGAPRYNAVSTELSLCLNGHTGGEAGDVRALKFTHMT